MGLTQQLVGPAVEGLADSDALLLVVLNGSEVSQNPHEAPEVHLVLATKQRQRAIQRSPLKTRESDGRTTTEARLRLPQHSALTQSLAAAH